MGCNRPNQRPMGVIYFLSPFSIWFKSSKVLFFVIRVLVFLGKMLLRNLSLSRKGFCNSLYMAFM